MTTKRVVHLVPVQEANGTPFIPYHWHAKALRKAYGNSRRMVHKLRQDYEVLNNLVQLQQCTIQELREAVAGIQTDDV